MNNKYQRFLPKLIFMCLITTSIVTTLSFSKYQTTVTGKSTNARVSVPRLSVALAEKQEDSLVIDCNTNIKSVNYSIIVSNKEKENISEVSLEYDIIITLPVEVASGLTVKVDGKETTRNKNKYTISKAGNFKPSTSRSQTHTLTFEANPDVIRNCELNNIKVTVYAEQID
ncbi:MAG: hypothetical protein IKL68_05535 [Clostridia bacterium]|nr:hypothetical protein [Clostridia bacterium]